MHKSILAGVSAAAILLSMGGSANAETLSIFGPWLTADQEHIEAVIAGFTAKTGIEVDYAGSDSFEQQIVIDNAGRFGAQRCGFPAAGSCRRSRVQGSVDPARR